MAKTRSSGEVKKEPKKDEVKLPRWAAETFSQLGENVTIAEINDAVAAAREALA